MKKMPWVNPRVTRLTPQLFVEFLSYLGIVIAKESISTDANILGGLWSSLRI